MTEDPRKPHDEIQRAYFDERADIFLQPIPEAVQKRTREIVKEAALGPESTVLDVGTGAGVLIGHFVEQGVKEANIVGCDLSPGMMANAKRRFPSAYFWHGDILDFPLDLSGRSDVPSDFPPHIKSFDAVFFNACFGNIFDQKGALSLSAKLLSSSGAIFLSHPMGARFVKALRDCEPHIVPHLLPNQEVLGKLIANAPLALEQYRDEQDLYLSVLRRTSQASAR